MELKVALQLYSVRDDMERDMEKTLKTVKEIGYDYVEFAGYFGRSALQVRAILDECGLECASAHQGYEVFLEDEKANIDYLTAIGAKYCAVPWMDKEKHKGKAAFEQTDKEFVKVASALKQAGIGMLYHNHDFEFERFEGKFLLDWLYESVPAELLQTEIDTCWVHFAGYDPCEYLRKFKGRSPVVHLKDYVGDRKSGAAAYALIDDAGNEIKNENKAGNFTFKPLGQGVQDFPAILGACRDIGAAYVVVEQDQSDERPPMDAARMSREYLRSLGL